jgi:hypothetical protein
METNTQPAKKLSEELGDLADVFTNRPVKFREVLEVTGGRGHTLTLITLSIPFFSPIPLPIISTILGLVIALIGLRISMGEKPWLPQFLMEQELPDKVFAPMLRAAKKLFSFLEWLLKPRYVFLCNRYVMILNGLVVTVCGLLLMIPFPVPFSSGFPAWTVLLIASGLLERDGYFIIAGYIMFVLTLGFFAGIFIGGVVGIGWVIKKMTYVFHKLIP